MNTPNQTPHYIWHVISRGNDGRQVFHDDDDYRRYLGLLDKYLLEYECDLHHYAAIPNHAHKLIGAADIKNISGLMQKLNRLYSVNYKEKYGGNGHLWRNRFKRYLITNDSYLQTCSVYIELNPVRAGLAKRPEDYAWSSCRAYLFDEPDRLIKHDPNFLGMGDDHMTRATAYKDLLEMWARYPVTKNDAKRFFRYEAKSLYPQRK